MKVLDLFAGIGGFSLAAHWMGWKTVAFVEWNPFCQKVLKKNFPNVPVFGDINKFSYAIYKSWMRKNLPDVKDRSIGIICGGFPCQPYSSAGNRLGDEDDRALWSEMFRIIAEFKPSSIVGENVAGILSMGNGETLLNIKTDLEGIGYQVEIFDIPAYVVGLQTLERHIWIVATSTSKRFKRSEANTDQDNRNKRQFSGTNSGINRRWNISETRFRDVAERLSRRMAGHQREQLKAAGNAIPPQLAFEIFKAIEEIEINNKPFDLL